MDVASIRKIMWDVIVADKTRVQKGWGLTNETITKEGMSTDETQDFSLSPTDGTAWLYNKRKFKDSCLLHFSQYRSNFVHVDNWSGSSICKTDDSKINEFSLDSDRTWAVTANTVAAAYRYYMYYTTQKKLRISRGAITLY